MQSFVAVAEGEEGAEEGTASEGDAASKPPVVTVTKVVYKHPEIPKPKAADYYVNGDMDRYYQADELKKLLAGDSDFYALFQEDMTGRPRGVALLLPEWGLGAANNRGIEGLRTILPDYGWVTLSMMVPSHQESVFISPKTPATTDQEPQTDVAAYKKPEPLRLIDETFFAQYQAQVKMRLLALINEAQNHQGYFIIIAQGSSAAAVASIYAQEELEEPEALILISAALPDAKLSAQMNQDITSTSIPTLDIYPANSYPQTLKNVKLRRKLAKKNFKASYRQQRLFGDISYHNQNRRLLKSVYGWLSSLGL
jgi:hypothetical protein